MGTGCVWRDRKMAYVRTIKFIYYTVCKSQINEGKRNNPTRFDFQSWIYKAEKLSLEQKTIEFDGIKARLENYNGDKEQGIWKLRFMKLRDTNIPSIVKEEREAKPIELEDDEYIGEDLLLIYDRKNQVAMVQCNRFALSKGKLEKYFNKIWDVKDEQIILCPISKNVDVRKFNKKNHRRIVLRFGNLHPIKESHRPFSKIVNSYYEMGGMTGEVVLSLGRGNKGRLGLNKKQVSAMLDDIYDNQDIVSDAVLKVKDDEDNSVDIVNLFDNSLCSYVDFKLEKRTTLEFAYATNLMINEYLGKKEEIDTLIS